MRRVLLTKGFRHPWRNRPVIKRARKKEKIGTTVDKDQTRFLDELFDELFRRENEINVTQYTPGPVFPNTYPTYPTHPTLTPLESSISSGVTWAPATSAIAVGTTYNTGYVDITASTEGGKRG